MRATQRPSADDNGITCRPFKHDKEAPLCARFYSIYWAYQSQSSFSLRSSLIIANGALDGAFQRGGTWM